MNSSKFQYESTILFVKIFIDYNCSGEIFPKVISIFPVKRMYNMENVYEVWEVANVILSDVILFPK